MGKRIKYTRFLTDDRNIDLQLDALHKVGIVGDHLYSGAMSGKGADRLGRSLPGLVRIVGGLEQKGVGFGSLPKKIETSKAVGRLVFDVFAALSELEHNLIRERTRAGFWAAHARGCVGGRNPKLPDAQINEMVGA